MATDDFFLVENSAVTFTFILLVLLIFSVSLFAVDLYWKCHPPKAADPRPSSDPSVSNIYTFPWYFVLEQVLLTGVHRLALRQRDHLQRDSPPWLPSRAQERPWHRGHVGETLCRVATIFHPTDRNISSTTKVNHLLRACTQQTSHAEAPTSQIQKIKNSPSLRIYSSFFTSAGQVAALDPSLAFPGVPLHAPAPLLVAVSPSLALLPRTARAAQLPRQPKILGQAGESLFAQPWFWAEIKAKNNWKFTIVINSGIVWIKDVANFITTMNKRFWAKYLSQAFFGLYKISSPLTIKRTQRILREKREARKRGWLSWGAKKLKYVHKFPIGGQN